MFLTKKDILHGFFWSNGLNLNKFGGYPPGDVAYIKALDLDNKVL